MTALSVPELAGDAELILGDCKGWIGQADCIITDPPYGETSLAWDTLCHRWPRLALQWLRPGGSMWVFGSLRSFMASAAAFDDWTQAQDVLWEKHNGSNAFKDRFRRVHEHAVQFYVGKWGDVYKQPLFTHDAVARSVKRTGRAAKTWGEIGPAEFKSDNGGPRLMRSVMFARSCHGSAVHPTQKPLDVLKPLIEYSCPPGGTVLDPFMGSGSTGVAALQLGRRFIGIELDPEYVALARERLTNETLGTQQ